jgi:cold shock CspA family protein
MSDTPTPTRQTGIVKWFNNKAGFGFVTVCTEGAFYKQDIFVHYSSISVCNSQYKYLIQGEYVEFDIIFTENGKHEHQAVNVTGIKGGEIMCETRKNNFFKPDPKRNGVEKTERRPERRPETEKKPERERKPEKEKKPEKTFEKPLEKPDSDEFTVVVRGKKR